MEEDADPALPPDVAAVTDAVAISPTLPTPSNADAAEPYDTRCLHASIHVERGW